MRITATDNDADRLFGAGVRYGKLPTNSQPINFIDAMAEGMGLRSNLLHFQVADSIIYFDEVASFSWCFGITSLAHSMPLGEIDIHPRNARGTAVYEDGASSLPFFTEKLICCKVACVEQVKG